MPRFAIPRYAYVLFSVIIPTYERRDLLAEALASVRAQTFTDYEVVVVDDGSNDGTWEGLLSLGDFVRPLRQPNRGPSAARNLGALYARGEYLAFLDSDDLLFPWTLETYASLIKKHRCPVFMAGHMHFFSQVSELDAVQYSAPKESSFTDYLSSSMWRFSVGGSSIVVYRSAFVAAGGFNENLTAMEDHDFALRLGCERGFVAVQEPPTIAYRLHVGSLTAVAKMVHPGAIHLLSAEQAGVYPGGRIRAKERRRIISGHIRPHSLALADAGEFGCAESLYLQILLWNIVLSRWRYVVGAPVRFLASRLHHALSRGRGNGPA